MLSMDMKKKGLAYRKQAILQTSHSLDVSMNPLSSNECYSTLALILKTGDKMRNYTPNCEVLPKYKIVFPSINV